MSTDLQEIKEILKTELPDRHSLFQLRYFVIGKEPTLQGKMWQCLREIKTRYDALESIDLESEESADNRELVEIRIKKEENVWAYKEKQEKKDLELSDSNQNFNFNSEDYIFCKKELEINIRKLKRQLKGMDKRELELNKRRKNTNEELKFFVESFKVMRKTEEVKPYDDLDTQTEYWSAKLSQKVNLNNLLGGKLDTELVDTVLALPDNAPIKKEVIYMIEKVQNNLLEEKAKRELECKKTESVGD